MARRIRILVLGGFLDIIYYNFIVLKMRKTGLGTHALSKALMSQLSKNHTPGARSTVSSPVPRWPIILGPKLSGFYYGSSKILLCVPDFLCLNEIMCAKSHL